MWQPPASGASGLHYELFCDGELLIRTALASFHHEHLTPGTLYRYSVTAVDTDGRRSPSSNLLQVRTEGDIVVPPKPEYPQWNPNGVAYVVGDGVTFEGKQYTCIQAHTSNAGWNPVAAFTLWAPVPAR